MTQASSSADTAPLPKNRETDPRMVRRSGMHTYLATHRKLIMHADLNAAGRLFGGRLMEWIDEAAALFCMIQIATRSLVTKKISEVIFNEPANLGDVLEFIFRVKDAGKTSIVIEAKAVAVAIAPEERQRTIVQCDLVFVALGPDGRPTPHHFVLNTSEEGPV